MITIQDIEEGLERNQFCLYYQPKFSLVSGQIAGSEALIRWFRPDGAMPQPAEFIALAEGSSLIKKISAYILPILLRDIPALGAHNLTPVSFNVSARDFEDDVFASRVLDAIKIAGILAGALVVEITENQALACDESIKRNLLLLRDAGIGLSMDDYGLGYSSVDTLSKWPFSSIKIDQGLIGRMLDSEKNAMIVRSAIRLGHELGIEVIAEGVETVAQYQFLLEAGCKSVQGFLICKPLSLVELMVRTHDHGFAQVPVALIHMALVDHLQWRRHIVRYALQRANLPADSAVRQAPAYPTLSYSDCGLGRWLYSDGQKFSGLEEFRNLEVSHRAMHAVGVDLVSLIQAGAGPVEVGVCIRQLQDASMQMLAQLTLLENFELATAYQGKP
jgi:EAL domain-containing protein (putative c-di-GMP-specific phosphodiesterase class I)